VLLTAAQSLLAVVLIMNLRMTLVEALMLAVLFVAQFLTPHSIVPRNAFSILYVALAAIFMVRQLIELRPYMRDASQPELARPA
jgi:cation:H+ antiporter